MRFWVIALLTILCLAAAPARAQNTVEEVETDETLIRIQATSGPGVELDFVKSRGKQTNYQFSLDEWNRFVGLVEKGAHQQGYTGNDESTAHRDQVVLGKVAGLEVWYYQDSALGDTVMLTDGHHTLAELNNTKSEEFLRRAVRLTQRLKNPSPSP